MLTAGAQAMANIAGSKSLLAAAIAISFAANPAVSAVIKATTGKDGRVIVSITGDISEGDSDTFVDAVKRANAAGKLVGNVRLDSRGGNLLEGVKLADAIRTGKIATNVGQSAVCASACFLAFAAGSEKNASYGAQIGVHGASDRDGQETVQSGAATVSMARVAKELGVPSAIIGRMVVTPPEQMVWLSPQELQSMGVVMIGKPSQTTAPDGPVAQQIPSPPNSLTPQLPEMKASKPPPWGEFVDAMTKLSSRQNGGRPKYFRTCQPELKVCTTGVVWTDNDGNLMSIKVAKDVKDNLVSREVCSFNTPQDIRLCLNWDSGKSHRDMKDDKGEWYKVGDD
jgi:hypothetical protein